MRKYKISKFAELIGRTPQTLRNWDKNGKFKPDYIDKETGYRYYTEEQLQLFTGEIKPHTELVVGYCRVSSQKQKDALERQIESVRTYMIAKGYQFKIISDIGSGINYDKKGLNKLMEMILNGDVCKIVVLYKDRLIRFGFEIIENICKMKGIKIEIIDNTEKTEEQEVVEDLIQIITVFSCRLQGKRAKNTKRLLEELKNSD